MLNSLIKFSLNNKLFILLGGILLIVAGTFTSQRMDIDVFPDFTAPTVVIMTDAHGLSAEEVERLVTFQIETAVNGATDVRRVRSATMQGYSFVWVEFDWGTDIFKARQIVSEKLITLGAVLPKDVVPVLAPQSSIMGEILLISLQSDTTSQMDLRTIAEWVVKPTILSTGGVSQVTIIGGEYKQYQILAEPQKMNFYDVTIAELANIGRTFSANSVGGIIRDYGNEYVVKGIARTNDLEALESTFIKTKNGKPVLVSDVANIVIGKAVSLGYGSKNAKPAVILAISKQPNINTLNVTEKVENNIQEIKKSLPKDITIDTRIFRQADFIEASVNNIGRALIEGAIFVIIILFLFLGSFRTTVISVVAIPLSLLTTILVLYALGLNINTMTLGGMCISIGLLVDDAIVDVENVYKRLRQNHLKPKNERDTVFNVVYEASKEVRVPILNSSLIIIAGFSPLFFLSGMEGRMLIPLGIAFIIALCASTIVALTVTPLMCKLMLGSESYLQKNEKEKWLSRKLSGIYENMLKWVLKNKKKVMLTTFGMFIVSFVLFFMMGRSFLPEFNEGSLVISAVTKPGVSLYESSNLGNLMEKELLKIPEVTGTARRTGRGELDEHSQLSNSAELDINFKLKDRSRDEFLADVRETLAAIPGMATTVGQPLGHRIDHMLSGTRANIAIKLFGSDLSNMYILANQIKNVIQGTEGLVDISVEQQTETPQLHIRANRAMLARYGITIEEFNQFVEFAFAGEKLADIYEGQRRFDLVLRFNKNYTENIDQLKSAMITTESGKKVPISKVAEIVSVGGPNSITRENVQRKIVVSANVAGRDMKSVVDDIKIKINNDIQLPEGYRIEYGGQFESAEKASRTLYIASIMAIFAIFLLLYGEFKNITLSAIVMINLPLALIGGVMAVFFTSNIISIPSIIGFITLFGIATRNGILLISKYQSLEQENLTLYDTILKGSIDRLNPILMTALTSALALIPLVLNGDKPGNEIQSPMAIVVLGGLITSTVLNIFIVPIFYSIFKKNQIQNNT